MLLIGITGGIGMGKSTVADYLITRGERVIDTDVLARQFVQPGQPALGEIESAFGPAVIDPSGSLNRSALAAIVFNDDRKRKALEQILHPRIRTAWQQWTAQSAAAGAARALVVIPLLFETAAEKELDLTVCVACSTPTQRARLQQRGWTDSQIQHRVAAQLPVRDKMDKAHRVVWNESSLDLCHLQVARILDSLS